jgi:hypothetical protein
VTPRRHTINVDALLLGEEEEEEDDDDLLLRATWTSSKSK